MKIVKLLSLLLATSFLLSSPVMAGSYGTKEEAQAMAEKAAALVKADPEAAFKKFQEKDGGFIDRDLYVFAFDKDGNFKAHGAKPVLVGKGGIAMKDVNGFAFVKAFVEVKDKAWVDYKWPDATDGDKIKDKSTYVIRVGDYVIGVGYFK